MTTRRQTVTDMSCPSALRDLTLRTPPNWTAICFITALGALHLSIAIHAFYHGRWEGFLSLALGIFFSALALACWLVCSDLTIEQRNRVIRLRTGVGRACIERSIPFQCVHGVRLLMMAGRSPSASRIEILCDNEDLECPPTDIPRQQALCLALAMNVRLIKVYGDDVPENAERLEAMPSDRI
jgi:hypothetical protein